MSRLNLGQSGLPLEDLSQIEIYCTVSVDATPWVYLTQYGGVPYMVLDLIISKTSSHQLGVVFKQEIVSEVGQNCVLVETIVSGSPAAIAEMRKGDILSAVDGKRVSNMSQVAKLVKSAAQRRFIIRVERKYSKSETERQNSIKPEIEKSVMDKLFDRKTGRSDSTVSRGDPAIFEDNSKSKFEGQIKFSDLRDSECETLEKPDIGLRLFRRRKSSIHVGDADYSQTPDTPSRRISIASNHSTASSNATSYYTEDNCTTCISDLYTTTREKVYASLVTFEETKNFHIDSELQYLNIGVWARIKGGEVPQKIIGYINAPMKLVLAQCSTSTTGHYLKLHPLLPPDTGKNHFFYILHFEFLIIMKKKEIHALRAVPLGFIAIYR